MPLCANCGTKGEPTDRFCRNCGAVLESSGFPTAAPVHAPKDQLAQSTLPYYLSTRRILLMVLLSYGLYLFYWFYLTWKQYREHTGSKAFPLWHALTLLVPVYGLFRAHAHTRAFRDLMVAAGIRSSLNPNWVVAILAPRDVIFFVVIINMVMVGGGTTSEPISQNLIMVLVPFQLVMIGLISTLLLYCQANLNRYWSSLQNPVSGQPLLVSANIGIGEVVLTALGLISWIDLIVVLLIPESRAGGFGL